MRWLAALVLGLSGCAGTFLTEVQTGYGISPGAQDTRHVGVVTAHIGGSEVPGFGIGLTGRLRGFNGGWAAPEVGPQVFGLYEIDEPWAFYARASPLVGLSSVGGQLGPSLGGSLNSGFIFYPGDSPLGVTLSLSGDVNATLLNDTSFVRGWVGLNLGIAIGGVKE